jgi:hypothetical protein
MAQCRDESSSGSSSTSISSLLQPYYYCNASLSTIETLPPLHMLAPLNPQSLLVLIPLPQPNCCYRWNHSQAPHLRGRSTGISRRTKQYLDEEGASQKWRANNARNAANSGDSEGLVAAGATRAFVRTSSNTLDLRGKNLDESKMLCDEFFNRYV